MRIIFDANVYIAALAKQGMVHGLLQTVLDKKSGFLLFISPDLIYEFQRKVGNLEKNKIVRPEDVAWLFSTLDKTATLVNPTEKVSIVKADPDDNKVLECAIEEDANIIITMDKDLLRLKTYRNIPIVHPNTFKYIIPRK